ncbi:MAG: hypothetical protein QMD99_20440 [Rhizobiaceae bacterium]|nr:hypothetical protein [Rhizobiaceae bacterium]
MFIKRWTIQRLTDRFETEWYMTGDQWSTDEEDAEEFCTFAKAQRRADRVGGEPCQHQRMATAVEAAVMAKRAFPAINMQAAE